MNVLVDSPVWSKLFRRKPAQLSREEKAVLLELRDLISQRRTSIIGPVRQEVLSGIRDRHTFDRLRDRLHGFDDLPLIRDDFEEAALADHFCRRRGIAGSPTDMLICAVAVRLDLPVFSTDKDFPRYALHVPVRLYELKGSTT